MKRCSICKRVIEINNFNKNKSKKDGLCDYCKECKKNHNKIYFNKNKKECSARTKKYYKNHKKYLNEKAKQKRIEKGDRYHVDYFQKNKDRVNEYQKKRKRVDPIYRIKANIRSRLSKLIKSKRWDKNNKFTQFIGCTAKEFKAWIEKQFRSGMTWDNYGEWHLDHKMPLAIAKTVEELEKLCHYTNLQPLWAVENLRKSDKSII